MWFCRLRITVSVSVAARLFDEAQGKYYAAQQRYAQYVDQNQALSRKSFQTEQERLQKRDVAGVQPLQPDGPAVATGTCEGPGIDPGLCRRAARDCPAQTLETFEGSSFSSDACSSQGPLPRHGHFSERK